MSDPGKARPWLEEIPKPKEILEEILDKLNREEDFTNKVRTGKISTSEAVLRLEKECYRKYLEYEGKVKEKWKDKVEKDVLEKSLMQSRATRAGDTVELIIQKLLEILNIPCERKVWFPKRNGEQLDIVIPDKLTLLENPQNAIIISIKREVRERWREVVGEAYILRDVFGVPDNIWFVAISCDVSNYAVRSMTKLCIRVYIPDKCFKDYEKYGARPLSQMFNDVIVFLKKKGIKQKSLSEFFK